jgi:hypothetical protein
MFEVGVCKGIGYKWDFKEWSFSPVERSRGMPDLGSSRGIQGAYLGKWNN